MKLNKTVYKPHKDIKYKCATQRKLNSSIDVRLMRFFLLLRFFIPKTHLSKFFYPVLQSFIGRDLLYFFKRFYNVSLYNICSFVIIPMCTTDRLRHNLIYKTKA